MFKRRGTTSGRRTSTVNGLSPASISANADISSSAYARRCRELLELDKDLRNLGAGMYFQLPQIAVIGGQSAGKSSLVEAVSGINGPRDSGTCTRCPMECTMTSGAESWSCEITLRILYDRSGNSLGTSTLETFGPPITDKNTVETWLRRAQAATLCPHIPTEQFLTKTEAELRRLTKTDKEMLSFSKNVVHVDVKDPELADLSFVDLPGLIQNSDPDMIDLVRDLVVSHIQGENTLILTIIPMSDDIENQQAVRLAKEADPEGKRTIGVLTKPDTLTRGAIGPRQKWREIIQGQNHQLNHGYYCVRLPDDSERTRKISRLESQRLASEFFSTESPWNEIADRNRFGIPGFVSDISKLLVQLIETNLPKLRGGVNILLAQCEEELSRLPPLPTNEPAAEVLLRITNFCRDFRAAVFGTDHKALAQASRLRYTQFKNDIYQTSPDFRPFVGHAKYRNPRPFPGELSFYGYSQSTPLDLMDVRKVIEKSTGWELPKHVPFDATRDLISNFTRLWRQPTFACFQDVFDISSKFVDTLLESHFGQFTQLKGFVGSLTRLELEMCEAETIRTLEKLLQLESVPFFTQNTSDLESEGKTWLARYKEVHRRSSPFLLAPPGPSEVQYVHREPEEVFQDELVVMANVQAYFQVVCKRVIDYIPMAIELELTQALADHLQKSLFSSLTKDLDTTERMKELLSEDVDIANKHNFLEERKARLLEIKQKLDSIREHP